MTAHGLQLAKDLALPLDTVTQKLAWLGVTGSGKTYGASKLAELLWHAAAQFVVLDPVGVWYGLRLAKDGKPSAITVPIFGGLHGDVPLEPTGGALLANLIVDKALSAIIDVSQFEADTDKARFAHDFADRFFFRKKAAPSAVHLFIEECQEFVPQNPQRGEERMLHAYIRMQKLGRNFGIGSSYISQRPQEVNKKALNMAQTLFVFRTTGTHERKAIESWIADKALDQDIAGDLPKIATGTCHVWSPEFLKISETAHILEKETFNASATPEVGAAAKARELAPIDLDQVRADMAATIEKAKADDPRELRKTIAELRKELSKAGQIVQVGTKTTEKIREKQILTDGDRALLEKLGQKLEAISAWLAMRPGSIFVDLEERLRGVMSDAVTKVDEESVEQRAAFLKAVESKGVQKILAKLSTYTPPTNAAPRSPLARRVAPDAPATSSRPARLVSAAPVDGLNGAQQKILDVVAMLGVRGITPDRDTVARWMPPHGVHPNGGTYGQNIGAVRANGYLDGWALTDKGQSAARAMETGLAAARAPLENNQRAIIDALEQHNGKRFTRETLAEVLGLHPNGGTYGQNIGRLRTMGLLPERGDIYLTEAAFR